MWQIKHSALYLDWDSTLLPTEKVDDPTQKGDNWKIRPFSTKTISTEELRKNIVGKYLSASRTLVEIVQQITPDAMTLCINIVQKGISLGDNRVVLGMLFDFDYVFN